MSLATAALDLSKSTIGLLATIVKAIFTIILSPFRATQTFIVSMLHIVQHANAQAAHLAGGVSKFVVCMFHTLALTNTFLLLS